MVDLVVASVSVYLFSFPPDELGRACRHSVCLLLTVSGEPQCTVLAQEPSSPFLKVVS